MVTEPSVFARAAARARQRLRAIGSEHGSPWRLAAACVAGAIVGSTPFYGLHLPISIVLAKLLRLNRVVVYGAANISIAPLAPFVAFACIEAGGRVLGATGGDALSIATLRAHPPWQLAAQFFWRWLVGAPIVGGVAGVALGAAVLIVTHGRRVRSDESAARYAALRDEVIARFAGAPIGIRNYVAWKTRLDPLYRTIVESLSGDGGEGGVVVDLGTGLGVLPLFLALSSLSSRSEVARIVGVDWDASKIAHAARAASGLPITLEAADLETWTIPAADIVVAADVLHYFDGAAQERLLGRAADALRPGGTVLVREGDRASRGAWWTATLERAAVGLRWNRGVRRPVWGPVSEIVEALRARGLTVDVVPVAGALHPGNVLVRARRAR